jgi:hypothetical protein
LLIHRSNPPLLNRCTPIPLIMHLSSPADLQDLSSRIARFHHPSHITAAISTATTPKSVNIVRRPSSVRSPTRYVSSTTPALLQSRPSQRMPSNFPTHTSKSATMRPAIPQAILSLETSHFRSLKTPFAAHIADFIPQSCYVSYIDPKAYQTTEWLSSLSDASSQSSALCRVSSITTPSFIAGSPSDDFQNYFKDDTTVTLEVNALSSSAVDAIGEADPQSPPHQHTPLLEIRNERAVNVKEGNDTLLEPSHAPITGQILTATALAVTSQDTVASGTYKEPRRSPRNSRTKTLDRGHRSASTSIQWPRTPRRLRSTQPPSRSMNQTTFSYTNSNTPKGSNRASHNLVEKQYRTRLNRQFGALLSAIPNDVIAADINGSPGKAVSKGAVLALAKRYIEALEKSKMNLEGDKAMLIGEIRRLRGRRSDIMA